jgi:DNA ligase-1
MKSKKNKKLGKSKIKSKTIKKCDKIGKSVWNVSKNGLMLAHNFRDNRTGKIKSAPKGYPQAPKGWYLSEKYDGYRALWDGKNFYSRGNNIFNVPDWFRAFMPPSIALDGELFLGRECFEQCGIFRRKLPDSSEWQRLNVKYQVFDSPTHSGIFEERQKFLQKLIIDRCKCDKKKLGIPQNIDCPLVYTKQIKVNTEKEVQNSFDKLVKKGAEGVMLRAPGSPYDPKRSSFLLKVKQLFDAECKIIGYKMGSGKYEKMLGAFKCQLVKNPKIYFDISGMNDSIRKSYKKTHQVGTIVTFTYMGLSNKGVPRHPNYLRIRKGKY